MTVRLVVNGKPMVINNEVIDRDIARLEEEGKTGKYEQGVYHARRPNIHGMLTCLRDQRKYEAGEIESVCMGICPHANQNPFADDTAHLDDCFGHMFNAVSLDGIKQNTWNFSILIRANNNYV